MKKVMILLLAVLSILMIVMNFPIFRIMSNEHKDFENIIYKNNDICVLEYYYTTGSGWRVIHSNDNNISTSENVAIYSAFDPRLLKENKEYDIDYTAKLIIKVDDVWNDIIDGENVKVISTDSIIIVLDSNKSNYCLLDMSMEGIFKSFLGLFNRRCRLSY